MTPQERLTRQLVAALREHLVTRKPPRVPEAGFMAWGWFFDLHSTRTSGLTHNPIGYAEIEAYARLRRLPLEDRHVALIKALDEEWLRFARAQSEKTPQQVSTEPLSPQMFDMLCN